MKVDGDGGGGTHEGGWRWRGWEGVHMKVDGDGGGVHMKVDGDGGVGRGYT